MAGFTAYDVFLKSLVARSRDICESLEHLSIQDFPSPAPQKAAATMYAAALEILEQAKSLSQQAGCKGLPELELEKEVQLLLTFLNGTSTSILPMLRASRSLEAPTEIVLPFQRIVSALFPQAEIIVGIMPEQNYYFREIGGTIRNWLSNFGLDSLATTHSLPSVLFRLDVPAVPPNNVLSHTSLAHELGHAVYNDRSIETIVLANPPIANQDIVALVEQILHQIESEPEPNLQGTLNQSRAAIDYATRTQIRKILGDWSMELYADAIGVMLLGPAFVCGTAAFFLPCADIDAPSITHPPVRYRIQRQLSILMEPDPGLDYSQAADTLVDSMVRPWSEYVDQEVVVPDNAIFRIVFQAAHQLKDIITREAKKAIPEDLRFAPQKFINQVPGLCDRILQGLPPNEIIDFASESTETNIGDFQSIINAGWQVYLCRFDELSNNFSQATDQEVLERFYGLLGKGLESSEIQLRYRDFSC